MLKRMRGKKGFTLIELIIVIAILAILALIGLPLIGQYMSDAEAAANDATAQVIGRAAEAYIAAHPTTADGTLAHSLLDSYLNSNAKSTAVTGVTITISAGSVSVAGPGTGAEQGHYPASASTPTTTS